MEKFNILAEAISTDRLEKYLINCNQNHGLACELYLKNLATSSGLYADFHWLEVCLRNTINKNLVLDFGQNWYESPKIPFGELELEKISHIKNSLRSAEKFINNSNIISNLTLGFWVNLFNGRYENLWRYSIRKSFKINAPTLLRKEMSFKLHQLLKIRNRIAHYEPVILGRNSVDCSDLIREVIVMIDVRFLEFLSH